MTPDRNTDNLFFVLGEWWERRPRRKHDEGTNLTRTWLPTPGNIVFTIFILVGLLWAQNAGAIPFAAPSAASTGTISYQGRLADAADMPLTGTYNMTFRLYSAASGGAPLWEETWTGANSVQVSDGLFNVMLGSLTVIPQSLVAANSNLFLGISVGTDSEMAPRVQLGSVPFAVQALTVPDGSITMAKLSSDISLVPPDGSITASKIADGAVTQVKAPSLVASGSGNGTLIRHGNNVFGSTDSGGFVTVSYPCFPNAARSFIATNGHWDANPITVVGHNGVDRCSTRIRMSSATGSPFRINWIAIGD